MVQRPTSDMGKGQKTTDMVSSTPSPHLFGSTRLRERRRQIWHLLVNERLTPTDTARLMNITAATVHSDLKFLRDNSLFPEGFKMTGARGPTQWTDETRQLLHELLRKGHHATEIAETMKIPVNDVYNILKYTDDKRLQAAWTRNKNMRLKKKPEAGAPTKADLIEARALKELGMSLNEASDRNILWMRANGYTHDMKTTAERAEIKARRERNRRRR